MISPRILFKGDPAEAVKYVGIAKKFARATFYAKIISKIWRISDDVEIRVLNNIQSNICKVWISVKGGFFYQFIGSSDQMLRNVIYGSLAGIERTIPHVYATLCTYRLGKEDLKLKVKALFSSAERDTETPERWVYNVDPTRVDNHAKIKPTYQIDGSGINMAWFYDGVNQKVNSSPWLLSTFGQSLPCHALHWLSMASPVTLSVADITYDFPPVHFPKPVGTFNGPVTDWWRRATLAKVITEEQSRVFIIMVDISHTFHVYPLGVREDEFIEWDREGKLPNILAENIKSATFTWPAWVTLQDVGQAELDNGVTPGELNARLQSLWQFSNKGDKAICIVAHRAAAWQEAQLINFDGTMEDRQEDTSGWVEVGFNITVTGEELLDFTFSVELLNSYDSRNGHAYPIEVGYLLEDSTFGAFDSRVVLEYSNYRGKTSNAGHLVLLPTMATIATVKVDDQVVKQWLALFDSQKDNTDGGYDWTPQPAGFFSVDSGDVRSAQFRFITHIVSMDIRSLSFCLAATIRYTLNAVISSVTWLYAANALFLELSVFGEIEQTESLGYSGLTALAENMFYLNDTYPDLNNMVSFSTAAVLDYAKTIPVNPELYSDEELATQFADVTWFDGLSGSVTESLTNASARIRLFGGSSYTGLLETGLFGTAETIYTPMVFLKFDSFLSYYNVGMVWFDDSVENGNLSFTGYPYGALYSAAAKFLTLDPLSNLHTRFSIHPSKSWAIWAGPFAANTVIISGTGSSNVVTETWEQVILDRIVAKATKPDDTLLIKETTHIEAFNSAFDKTLTQNDFYFNLGLNLGTLSITPNSIEKGVSHPESAAWPDIPLGIGFTDRYLNVISPLLPAYILNTTMMYNFYDPVVVHDTYSAYTTFPTPRMTGVWAKY